jgi:hypothetical protein
LFLCPPAVGVGVEDDFEFHLYLGRTKL